jgi:para-aminobenzoate synthetase component 1
LNETNTTCSFTITDFNVVKKKMLNWSNQFGIFCFLDNHNYQIGPNSIECILAADVKRKFKADPGNAINDLQKYIDENRSWLFGHLGYDLRNEIDDSHSNNADHLGFPTISFFEPEYIIRLSAHILSIESSEDPETIFKQLMGTNSEEEEKFGNSIDLQHRISRNEYIETINKLKSHILRGDCYEINFCQEFFSENTEIDPINVYSKLSSYSPNPFSALYKLEDKFLICASPERFLKKQGTKILSQPIKGTSSRFLSDSDLDKQSREKLNSSNKDRSENVMVVDLVRNDLSKVCIEGTVHVDELYGIYSFPQVHQMISTISGKLKENISFAEIIRATFPMASMTGAPKKRVMELIEQYERSSRGIFSGALGYLTPDGDFDFNVVIRSIMYNATDKYLSYMAGSGITFYSDAEKEYEECLLKAEAMKTALTT